MNTYHKQHGLREQIKKAKTKEEAKVILESVVKATYPQRYIERCKRIFNLRFPEEQ